ncbi:uncharacterized protein SPSK_04846 [Sporothrix schenckii 1099-18]|uniref:Peptidase S8/S53 domain-containing protein n=1 Tax=Sporothrix schenckii 1099-18 TaxID=1397361 RepID=A0A0F2LU88_SPOSC|nr:uncharacterized protein SPSK_04846 [Sporothrix schenckii 1099-18]KJR81033.1 hypothetical protein SPSK_04846 [Sporothrix schenckii 1099-18]
MVSSRKVSAPPVGASAAGASTTGASTAGASTTGASTANASTAGSSTAGSSTAAGKLHKKNTVEMAMAVLENLDLGTGAARLPDTAKYLGFDAVSNKMLKIRAHTLHMGLANRFNSEVCAPDRKKVLKELLEGKDPETGRPWNTSLLLAEGSQGLIVHTLLNPSQFLEDPSKYNFCRLRAFISLLLEIEPSILVSFDKSRRTPLHCLIFSATTEEDEAVSSTLPNLTKEAIITFMCTKNGFDSQFPRLAKSKSGRGDRATSEWRHVDRRQRAVPIASYQDDSDVESVDEPVEMACSVFGGSCAGYDENDLLCCICDCGIAMEDALTSLQELSNMDSGLLQFHAVHAAIEEDIAFPPAVVDALSPCFDIVDSFGRTCLHIALSMPFTDTKIQWAKSLARMCPRLLAESCDVYVTDSKKKKATPLQFLAEQRFLDPMPRQRPIKAQSYRFGQDNALAILDIPALTTTMDTKLAALEDDLKLHCLAAFEDSEICRSFMYTESNEKEIDFPLKDMVISKTTLDSLCQHFQPDRQLKSVSIENVLIEWDQSSKPYLDAQAWGCAGNSDLYLAFNWLKQAKSVRKVFQVSVNDFDDQSTGCVWRRHSDKAIVECLKGLDVETWDWKRFDIPCSAIQEAAGDTVRTLYLYSSGLDAVLESWASLSGLPRLPKLEYIYLCAGQGLESQEHAKNSASNFKSTIEKNYKAVNGRSLEAVEFAMLQTPEQRALDDRNNSVSASEHEANEWLHSMDQFSAFMDQIGKGASKTPIKVALIDDGVKSNYRALDDNILCGQSWPTPKTIPQKTKVPLVVTSPKYNSSQTGHGTIMAWYIRRMCPNVKLCVAKLDPVVPAVPTVDDKVTFTVESVIKAIWWAITKKVDVISMSWAIDDNMPTEIKNSLSRAIRHAIDSNILIFCANPDKGAEYPNNLTYPYHLEKERIFCIGAAGRNGKRWDWIDARDKSCDYLLPGVDLEIHMEAKESAKPIVIQPSPLISAEAPLIERPLRERSKQSGSSLACALASGLAAMILHSCRVSGATYNEIDYLRTFDGMKSALNSLYPDGGAAALAAGEGQWLPASSLPSGRNYAHISSTDKKLKVLEETVAKFLEKMPGDYVPTVPPSGRLTRTSTMNGTG